VNRESKRMMERRRGREEDDGFSDVADVATATAPSRGARVPRTRTTPFRFVQEIRDELRQVAWPTRAEMVNYSMVVFFTLILMISLIYLLNYAFGHGIFYMFQR
jgi:preprotein translocase subunit SecE